MTKDELVRRLYNCTVEYFDEKSVRTLVDAYSQALLQQTPCYAGEAEPPPCSHLPMIDTGVGYLLCEACGWSQKIDGGGA